MTMWKPRSRTRNAFDWTSSGWLWKREAGRTLSYHNIAKEWYADFCDFVLVGGFWWSFEHDGNVTAKIKEQEGIPAHQQWLIFVDNKLEDGRVISPWQAIGIYPHAFRLQQHKQSFASLGPAPLRWYADYGADAHVDDINNWDPIPRTRKPRSSWSSRVINWRMAARLKITVQLKKGICYGLLQRSGTQISMETLTQNRWPWTWKL